MSAAWFVDMLSAMPTTYIVRQGDCWARIARQFGFADYKLLYDDPANEELLTRAILVGIRLEPQYLDELFAQGPELHLDALAALAPKKRR